MQFFRLFVSFLIKQKKLIMMLARKKLLKKLRINW